MRSLCIFKNMIPEKSQSVSKDQCPFRDLLTQPQWEAVSHINGPLLILAGAGSGKTRVITYRICYLVQELGLSPTRIIAVTFTNKAASEMKNRMEALIGDQARRMWISTFHSACVRILRRDINRLDIPSSFAIFDADDQLRLMKCCFKEANVDVKVMNPSAVLSAISRAKNDNVSADDYAKRAKNFLEKKVSNFYHMYEKALRLNNALDFDDLIMMTIRLFRKHPDILEHYQERWQFILVDEYQDTNLAQSALLDLLAAKTQNLCVVGDDDQSIYRWRGAEVRNILHFEKRYPHARIIRLEQNYRSTKKILDVAGAVIEKNRNRKGKKLWTANEHGDPITIYSAEDEHDEASYISQTIKNLSDEGDFKSLGDFCILYRVNAQSRVLEDALRKQNMPYRIVGGTRFYERMEIKDCLAYMRAINNPRDNISLSRIINSPPRGIGKATLDKLDELSAREGISLFEAIGKALEERLLPAIAHKRLDAFYSLINGLRDSASRSNVTEIFNLILKKTGYLSYLEKGHSEQAEARIENVKELVSAIQDFENADLFSMTQQDGFEIEYKQEPDSSNLEGGTHPSEGGIRTGSGKPTLSAFLDHVSLLTDLDTYEDDKAAVTLMTLHSAKGLEFPVVFITGMEQGIFPHSRSLESHEEFEEERRLCYVGITRAKKRLYLTYAHERNIFGYTHYNSPSIFLEDLPDECIMTEDMEYHGYGMVNPYPSKAIGHSSGRFKHIARDKEPVIFKQKEPAAPPVTVKSNVKPQAGGNPQTGEFTVGASVMHPQWGKGSILQIEGKDDMMKLVVAFRGQKKKLMARYANLQIIQ
ncbi:UvrD-helicase domain-containing protein [bacterium]|nr:UvrD-helicase domain-containing protein [bacterium]